MPEREPFFPNSEGGFYGKRGLEKTFRQVLKKAAITGTGRRSPRLYDFRHTFATHRLYRWMREGKDLNAMLPYLAISSAPVIRWNASSVTNSGDARSARVILQQPTAMAFAAW